MKMKSLISIVVTTVFFASSAVALAQYYPDPYKRQQQLDEIRRQLEELNRFQQQQNRIQQEQQWRDWTNQRNQEINSNRPLQSCIGRPDWSREPCR